MWKSANLAFSLVPDADPRRRRGDRAPASRRAEAALSAEDGRWRVDGHDEPDRTAGRLRSRRQCAPGPEPEGDHYRISARRSSSPGATTTGRNIVHLVLARTARRAGGPQGISLFIVPEVPGQRGRHLGARNDVALRLDRAQARHPRQPDRVMAFGDKDGAIGDLVGEPRTTGSNTCSR